MRWADIRDLDLVKHGPGRGYVITSDAEARKLANLIIQDDGKCLEYKDDGNVRWMYCDTSHDCGTTRRRLAAALADHYLRNFPK